MGPFERIRTKHPNIMKHIPAILTTTLLAVAGAEAKPIKVFIRDVRKDLNAPKMPFVIGVMGVGGLKDQSTSNVETRCL
jgi:hypothetical protein